MNSWNDPLLWRRRLVRVRGVLVTALALLFLLAELHAALPIPALLVVGWLTLLLLPSVLFLATRKLPAPAQPVLLTVELLLDQLFFLFLMHQLGGSTNPLAYYLLIPVLIGALSQPLAPSILHSTVAIGGYGLTLHWHIMPGADTHLHALTHDMHDSHGFGMWLAFGLIALVLNALGQMLRNAELREQQRQASALTLALQRERMYQVAGTLADRAHELNTPLASLMLISEELQASAELPETLRPPVNQLRSLAERIGELVRPPAGHTDAPPARLSVLCEELGRTLRHLAPGIRINWEGPEDPLFSQPAAWQRILANLGYNACDAGARAIHVRCERDGEHWLIQFSDDGPTHATSADREGMGIGLALVETTLTALDASLTLTFHHQWTQARIRAPAGAAE